MNATTPKITAYLEEIAKRESLDAGLCLLVESVLRVERADGRGNTGISIHVNGNSGPDYHREGPTDIVYK